MTTTEKYIDFILDNFIGDKIRVQLPRPEKDGRLFWVKLGVVVYQEVQIEVLERYTRSVKVKLSFDKYEIEQLFFIPIESAPTSIKSKFLNKVEKLVCNAFIEDGRKEDLIRMYHEKHDRIFSQLIKK